MKLHPVTHGPRKNRFCGPAALSAITGHTTDAMARMLRSLNDRRSITGTSHNELARVFGALGFSMWRVQDYGDRKTRPTLAAWLKRYKREAGAIYLLEAGRHWQVISGRRYVCGRTEEIVPLTHPKVKRRARVRRAWLIERKTP